jgi:hypothetical protein
MKNWTIFTTKLPGVVCKILISALLILQANIVFAQTQESLASTIEKPVAGKHSDDCVLPPGWESAFTSYAFIFLIQDSAAAINGTRVNTCDCVGCFYEDNNGKLKCGGADFFVEGQPMAFPVFGDDPITPEKDGFDYGDTIHFKIFSWSCAGGRSIDVDTIRFGIIGHQINLIWPLLEFSPITYMAGWTDFNCQIAATNPENKKVNLSFQKGWNTFTYQGNGQDRKNLIAQLGKRLVVIKESKGSGIIWPEKGIYTLDGLIRGGEYLIMVSEDCEIYFSR